MQISENRFSLSKVIIITQFLRNVNRLRYEVGSERNIDPVKRGYRDEWRGGPRRSALASAQFRFSKTAELMQQYDNDKRLNSGGGESLFKQESSSMLL